MQADAGLYWNDDALLRWNACARIIMSNGLASRLEERVELQSE